MSTEYSGASVFHTAVTDLADTELVSHDSLYVRGIRKLADRGAWLRDEIVRRTAALASATAGTAATVTGSVDLTTLTYDPTSGTLNGLTFQIQSNNSGLKTVTFGTGAGLAPANGADVVAQINTATGSNPFARIDSAGHLSVASTTTGGTGTINIAGGSAVTLLGFTVAQNATGQSAGGDGVSLVGLAAITGSSFNISTGTLRAALQSIADTAGRAVVLNTIFGALGATVTRQVACQFTLPVAASWTVNVGGYVQTTVSTLARAGATIPGDVLPHGVRLQSISIPITPAAHASIAGLTLPVFTLAKTNAAGATTTIATLGDQSGNFTAYSLAHSITLSGLNELIDRSTYGYTIDVATEFGGGNAASGATIGNIVTLTYTGI